MTTAPVTDSYPFCENCKSQRAASLTPFIFDILADYKDPFRYPVKQVSKYLCGDCYNMLSRKLSPGFTRLREAQELLDGKSDEESDEKEEE